MKIILCDKSFICSSYVLPISIILLCVCAVLFIFCSILTQYPINAATNINDSIANLGLRINNYDKRIAFVEPTFTYAAYRNGSFYNFYNLYSPTLFKNDNATITTDLKLLKDRPIPHGPFPYFEHPSYSDIPYKNYFDLLLQHVKKNSTQVTNFTDVDVHQGKIFQNDGKNAYDILFLFHNEYLTQPEYNNLKQFVFNGGTIVFTEANILYAEVSYNKTNDSITLVNGHNWKLDGKAAQKGFGERWLNENKEWMGSNYLNIDSDIKIPFRNNPFNYTHDEEQYVTNPNAKILLNYQVYNIPKKFIDKYPHPIVATYEMNFGKGKIINLGIWGHRLVNNENFLNYFDKVIIPLAFDLPIKNTLVSHNETSFSNKPDIYNNASSHLLLVNTNKSRIAVNYSQPLDIKNIYGNFSTICNPSPGSTFPIGDTVVKCIATDKTDNNTVISKFLVRVVNDKTSK